MSDDKLPEVTVDGVRVDVERRGHGEYRFYLPPKDPPADSENWSDYFGLV